MRGAGLNETKSTAYEYCTEIYVVCFIYLMLLKAKVYEKFTLETRL